MSITVKRRSGHPLEVKPIDAGREPDDHPEDRGRTARHMAEGISVAAAVVTTVVTYTIFLIRPWPHTPLSQFLAMFDRNNAAVWPMQIFWYVAALAIVGLALSPVRRASKVVCLLAAAYSAWIGIAYFARLNPGMNFSWAWAAVFTGQAVLSSSPVSSAATL